MIKKMGVVDSPIVKSLHTIARNRGSRVYLVGGMVRDSLLNIPSEDFDFVVFGDVDGVALEFARSHGCSYVRYNKRLLTYRIFCKPSRIDITEPRGSDIVEDLKKRDFSVDSIAYDPETKELIDPLGGQEDLKKRIIRINLRAFRLAAFYRFDLDATTLKFAQRDAHLLEKVSGERITDELKQFFMINNTYAYLLLMDKAGVIDAIFEDLALTNGCIQSEQHLYDVKTHSLSVYNFVEWSLVRMKKILKDAYPFYIQHYRKNRDVLLPSFKLAALFHDAAKPSCKVLTQEGRVRFPGHEKKSAQLFLRYAERYPFGKEIFKMTRFLIENHIEPSNIFALHNRNQLSDEHIVDFFIRFGENGIDLLFFALADTLAKGKISASRRGVYVDFLRFMALEYYTKIAERMRKKSVINGRELMENLDVDVKKLSYILENIRRMEILGRIKSRDEALTYARNLVDS